MPAPMRGAGVQLGVVVDLTQYDEAELDIELDRIGNAGITHLRQSFSYSPSYNWKKVAD